MSELLAKDVPKRPRHDDPTNQDPLQNQEIDVEVGRFQLQRQRTQIEIQEPRLRVRLFTPVMYLVL